MIFLYNRNIRYLKKNLIFLAGELTKFLDFSQCDSITYHIFLLLLSKIKTWWGSTSTSTLIMFYTHMNKLWHWKIFLDELLDRLYDTCDLRQITHQDIFSLLKQMNQANENVDCMKKNSFYSK